MKMVDGSYDSFVFERLNKMDLRGKVVYDVGAHIGFHSLYFSRIVGKQGKVYAFEPSPKNVERFRTILDKNEGSRNIISIFTKAVSADIGVEVFNINNNIESGRSTGNFLESADTVWERGIYIQKGFTKVQVETVPIDAFKRVLSIKEDPDLIKIDVEGAEYAVLQGAKETLLRKKPVLMIEVHSIANMFSVVTFLNSISYEMELIGKVSHDVCYLEARPKK
jgi:FkbM family methyltransferase